MSTTSPPSRTAGLSSAPSRLTRSDCRGPVRGPNLQESCEVLAIPNLVSGHDDQIGCILYTPIDGAEEARAASRAPASAAAQR